MLDLLITQFTQAIFGDNAEVRWIELDVAFLKVLKQCQQYTVEEINDLFQIWLNAFDHVNPQSLPPEDQEKLVAAIETVITYKQRLN